ncbi:hypothetical protein BDR26DRAFT_873037 [Obelidium mucronatum]|nr:hypothetical protein BDR26DRAFT_873037 [Obelidium mucronatum]
MHKLEESRVNLRKDLVGDTGTTDLGNLLHKSTILEDRDSPKPPGVTSHYTHKSSLTRFKEKRAKSLVAHAARREAKLQLEWEDAFFANKTKDEIEIKLFGSIISDDEEEILPLPQASVCTSFKTHLWSAWVAKEHEQFLQMAQTDIALWTRMLEAIKRYLVGTLAVDQLRVCRIYIKNAPAPPHMMIPDALKNEYIHWFGECVKCSFRIDYDS